MVKLALVNEKLQMTLDREQEKCETIEEDLSTTAGSLKKQLRDESHARTVLQVGIFALISLVNTHFICHERAFYFGTSDL